jgi:peptide/nickel transport system permease protein
LQERLKFASYLFRRNPLSLVGLAIVLLFILVAIFAPVLATHDPVKPDVYNQHLTPSREHLFGTDTLGMDIFSRTVYAARIDLYVAFFGVVFAAVLGVVVGAVAGYFGGLADDLIMRFLDSQQAFPTFILALAIVAALGQNLNNIVAVLVIVNYPGYARLVRAQMLSVRERQYADAARAAGNSTAQVIFKHLLPNCMGPIYVQASLNAGWGLLLAAGLSFIGFGVRVPTPEWGIMVSEGAKEVIYGKWWISFFPGMAIFLSVLGFNLLGDGLQDVFDPKRR